MVSLSLLSYRLEWASAAESASRFRERWDFMQGACAPPLVKTIAGPASKQAHTYLHRVVRDARVPAAAEGVDIDR